MKIKVNPLMLLLGILAVSCTPQEIERHPQSEMQYVNQSLSDTGDDTDTHADNKKDADE